MKTLFRATAVVLATAFVGIAWYFGPAYSHLPAAAASVFSTPDGFTTAATTDNDEVKSLKSRITELETELQRAKSDKDAYLATAAQCRATAEMLSCPSKAAWRSGTLPAKAYTKTAPAPKAEEKVAVIPPPKSPHRPRRTPPKQQPIKAAKAEPCRNPCGAVQVQVNGRTTVYHLP